MKYIYIYQNHVNQINRRLCHFILKGRRTTCPTGKHALMICAKSRPVVMN